MAEAQGRSTLQDLIYTDEYRASAIDARHRVVDQHSEALELLSLIGQVGHPEFEEAAFAALQELKMLDEGIPTNIDRALERVEHDTSLRRYQAMWREQNGVAHPNTTDLIEPELSREEQEAMDDWVEARVTSQPVIKIRLPPKRRPSAGATSHLRANGLLAPASLVPRVRKDDGGVHPAAVVTAPGRSRISKPRPNAPQVSSSLEGLFSKEGEQDTPEFLRQPAGQQNRRLAVQLRQQEHKKKMMRKSVAPQERAPAPESPRNRRIKAGAKPRYEYVSDVRSVVLQKNPGERVDVRVDPESLTCIDSRTSDLVACRGMRLTAVTTNEDGNRREVHTRKELDRALAYADSDTTVTLTFEPCSRKHLIEKRKRDWKEKVAGKLPGK
eukprot:Hpha_TRINITY_DN12876_c0_g1::TRINITY_DN12876_c0_g1_i2::g.24278::m.24278